MTKHSAELYDTQVYYGIFYRLIIYQQNKRVITKAKRRGDNSPWGRLPYILQVISECGQ